MNTEIKERCIIKRKPLTEAHKNNISKSLMGDKNPNFGKKRVFSKTWRENLSKAAKERKREPHSEITKQKMRESHLDKKYPNRKKAGPPSEIHRMRISWAQLSIDYSKMSEEDIIEAVEKRKAKLNKEKRAYKILSKKVTDMYNEGFLHIEVAEKYNISVNKVRSILNKTLPDHIRIYTVGPRKINPFRAYQEYMKEDSYSNSKMTYGGVVKKKKVKKNWKPGKNHPWKKDTSLIYEQMNNETK